MFETHLYDWAHAGETEKVRQYLTNHPEAINAPIGEGYTLLHVACLFGHESLAAMLLGMGALTNVNATNESRATALHCAVSFRDEDVAVRMIQMLLSNGAELNAMQNGGQTALHHAVGRGSEKLTATLMEAGADPFLKDDLGQSASALGKRLHHSI